MGETVFTVGYETRGAVWEFGPGDIEISYSYVQALLGNKFLFPGSGSVSPYITPSIAVGLLLDAEAEGGGLFDDMLGAGPFDVELAASAGAQIEQGRNAFFAEIGYSFGLVDATPDVDYFSARNVNIKLRAGFLLGLGS